ncbi:MAG: hypothetical protein C0446_13650 [Chitinophaga sp.]|nr:hypothetical protein [Chitinophaga sp.]
MKKELFLSILSIGSLHGAHLFEKNIGNEGVRAASRFSKVSQMKLTPKHSALWGKYVHQLRNLPLGKSPRSISTRSISPRSNFLHSNLLSIQTGGINWEGFSEPWHAFLILECDPPALYWSDNFPFAQTSENDIAKRPKRQNRYLVPDFMPKNFSSDILQEWGAAYQDLRKTYLSGHSKVGRFYYDLLRRKIIASGRNHMEATGDFDPNVSSLMLADADSYEAYSIEELAKYYFELDRSLGKNSERKLFFYPIPNGLPITLNFKNGIFQSAYSSSLPDLDITSVIHNLAKVPKVSISTKSFNISGFLYLPNNSLESFNIQRIKNGLNPWIDSYSAIVRTVINPQEPNKDLEMQLQCVFDKISYLEDKQNPSLYFQRKKIAEEGFATIAAENVGVSTWENSTSMISSLQRKRFDVAGIKISLVDYKDREALYKFVPQTSRGVIKSIKFELADGGNLIAVVNAEVNGSSSKYVRFMIGNANELERLNIQVDDDVEIVLPNNGMSPYIHYSLANGRKQRSAFPSNCPVCNGKLTYQKKDENLIVSCSAHLACKAVTVDEILRFTSAQGLYIPSITRSIIEELKRKTKTFSPADLFLLSEGDFLALSNVVDKEYFYRLLSEINAAKNTHLSRFLFAIGIPKVDQFIAENLADKFYTLSALRKASVKDLQEAKGVDLLMAREISTYLSNRNNLSKITKILESGVIIQEPDKETEKIFLTKPTDFTQKEYNGLIKKIQSTEDSQILSDRDYDKLCDIATQIESKHPDWKIKRSSVSSEMPVIKLQDQFTLLKTYERDKIHDLCKKSLGSAYSIEPKVNGVACILEYVDGKLARATTKKNSSSGHDISAFVTRCLQVPRKLHKKFSGIIRGELYISKSNFAHVNKNRLEEGLASYVDSLSFVVGTLNTKNVIKETSFLMIEFFPFDFIPSSNQERISTRTDLSRYFNSLGFHSSLLGQQKTLNEDKFTDVLKYVGDVQNGTISFDADIDGLVIKSEVDPHLKNAVGYKFNQESMKSKLSRVTFSLTSSGRLVAIAYIDPLRFKNGRTVSRVHIPDMRVLKDVHQGDYVAIQYSSGSSPRLLNILPGRQVKDGEKLVVIPKNCPNCSKHLHSKTATIVCLNQHCKSSKETALQSFAKKMGFITPLCSKEHIHLLINSGLVNLYEDFWHLTLEDMVNTAGLPNIQAERVLSSIQRGCRKISPAELFYYLNSNKMSVRGYERILKDLENPKAFLELSVEDLIKYGIPNPKAVLLHSEIQKNKEKILLCLDMLNPDSNRYSATLSADQLLNNAINIFKSKHQVVIDSRNAIRRTIDSAQEELAQLAMSKQHKSWLIMAKQSLNDDRKLLQLLEKSLRSSESLIHGDTMTRKSKDKKNRGSMRYFDFVDDGVDDLNSEDSVKLP